MKQVVQQIRTGKTELSDVPPPTLGRGEVLVATEASLISAGTEKMLIDFANKSALGKAKERPDLVGKVVDKLQRDGLFSTMNAVYAQLEQPLPLGYSAAGRVIAVSEDMKHLYKEGDRVAVAGAGLANHAEINAIPKNLMVPVPESVSFEHASFATLTSIAMHGFRSAKPQLGDTILVMGLGLVGQLAAQIARASGAKVFAVDYDKGRIETAKECGIKAAHSLEDGNLDDKVSNFTKGKGFDKVLICAATDSSRPIEQAATWARDRADIVLIGKTGTTLPHRDFMQKELNFVVSRSYGPGRYDSNYEQKGQDYPIGYVRWTERENLAEAIRLMETGDLKIAPLMSHTYPIEEAEEAYGVVVNKAVPQLGVVLTYGRSDSARETSKITLQPTATGTDTIGFGVIGAGAFARGVMIPKMKKMKDVSLTGIISKGGLSAQAAGKRFGFGYATSKTEDVMGDSETQAVFIATRHDSHAQLVTESLKAGKHVIVEKPLALTSEQLDTVESAARESGKVLMVGFNRRFSPFTEALTDTFSPVTGPKQVIVRVNAGFIPGDNWQHDSSIGGGRLLGEVCHFTDLAVGLVGHDVETVHTTRGAGQDNYNIVMTFTDGSTATVVYTSEGDTRFSKERIEMYGGGMVGVIDNFRKGFVIKGGKTRKVRACNWIKGLLTGGQDKGHGAELRAFVDAIKGDSPMSVTLDDFLHSSRVVLAAAESLKTGEAVKL